MNSNRILTLCPECRQQVPCWQHTQVTITAQGRTYSYPNLMTFVTQLANNQLEIVAKLKELSDAHNAMIQQIEGAVKLMQESGK